MRSNRVAIIAFSLALATAGCHKRVPVAALPLPPPPVAVPVPAPPLPPPPEPAPAPPLAPVPVVSPLFEADRAFLSAHYDDAARLYEDYLRNHPSGDQRDEALFHLGLIYASRPAPATDWQRASARFKQLIDEFPNSPFRPSVNLVLSLRSDLDQAAAEARLREQRIRQLTTELDRLKKIDADRRKRP